MNLRASLRHAYTWVFLRVYRRPHNRFLAWRCKRRGHTPRQLSPSEFWTHDGRHIRVKQRYCFECDVGQYEHEVLGTRASI